jgi:hypothetical protein
MLKGTDHPTLAQAQVGTMWHRHLRWVLPAITLFLPAAPLSAGPAPGREEQLLREAGVTPDGPGLRAFFRARTPSPEVQRRLRDAAARLGSDSFAERERAEANLRALGRLALPHLRPLLDSPSLEVRRRARACVQAIDARPEAALVAAAAKLSAAHPPEGIVPAILGCLPGIDNEVAEAALVDALAAVALKDGRPDPALLAAARDDEPARRAAAASVLARVPAGRAETRRLLGDPDPKVRFHAAWGLLRAGEKSAVPVLAALLAEAPLPLAWRAEEALYRLAGDQGPRITLGQGEPEARKRCRRAWEAWWEKACEKVDPGKVDLGEMPLGLTLITELDGPGREGDGRIWECGADGRPRWQIEGLERPLDAHLLRGGRILSVRNGGEYPRVAERNLAGKVLWEHRLDSPAVSCQRLPDGHTLAVTHAGLQELTADHKVVVSYRVERRLRVWYGRKLPGGHFILALGNDQLIELDGKGKEVCAIPTGGSHSWASVEGLGEGRYLVALYLANKVIEVDTAGKVLWEAKVDTPGHATRLANGHTLVTSIEERRVVELDRAGKVVWSVKTRGRPFHAYRR